MPMRGSKSFSIILALVLATTIVPLSDDSDATSIYWGLMLDMVCPTSTEGFALYNCTFHDIDLGGYSVTDGEGTVTFTPGTIIHSGYTYTFLTGPPEPWMEVESYYIIGGDESKSTGRFSLADGGDDIYLKQGDTVLDSFAWGTTFTDGWTGDGLAKIPKKTVAIRNHEWGKNGETEVWKLHVPGMTLYHYTHTYLDSKVTPFSFPESDGSEIIAALQGANEEVCISIYTISHPSVASVLAHLLTKGVKVKILAEGSPAGGIPYDEIQMLTALWKNGADIHIIRSEESCKRYAFVHSKYAVIDESAVIITSENWTESSFSSNRGWGCVIENRDCARYLKKIFVSDFDPKHIDIHEFRDLYPTSTPSKIKAFKPVTTDSVSYIADVTPVVAPDYSWKTLMTFIGDAKERLYSQQLNIEYSWTTGFDNPLSLMEDLGHKGVDCRALVDVTYDSPTDNDYKDGYGLCAFYDDSDSIKMRYQESTEFSMAHNKGVICDDRVWIGSMNWTDNSIRSNREISVIIDSAEITDMFAELYLKDWGIEFDGEVVLKVDVPDIVFGTQATLSAAESSVPQGSVFEWDLDGDGESERTGKTVSWKFYEESECTLTVTIPDGTQYTYDFTVTAAEDGKDDDVSLLDGPVKYIPLVALVIILIVMKRIRSGNDR